MPQRAGGFFHLHLVSDATGETLITVARAAAAQYASVAPIEHIYPLVRTEKQLDRVISEIEAAPGIVVYTMLDAALADLDLSRQWRREDRECAARAEYAGADPARAVDSSAGGRTDGEPRAHRADPPEPPARAERSSRRRSLCRSPGGRGGDRVLAQALRPAQLADDRRHAPLHRGDRSGRDVAVDGAPPAGCELMP